MQQRPTLSATQHDHTGPRVLQAYLVLLLLFLPLQPVALVLSPPKFRVEPRILRQLHEIHLHRLRPHDSNSNGAGCGREQVASACRAHRLPELRDRLVDLGELLVLPGVLVEPVAPIRRPLRSVRCCTFVRVPGAACRSTRRSRGRLPCCVAARAVARGRGLFRRRAFRRFRCGGGRRLRVALACGRRRRIRFLFVCRCDAHALALGIHTRQQTADAPVRKGSLGGGVCHPSFVCGLPLVRRAAVIVPRRAPAA